MAEKQRVSDTLGIVNKDAPYIATIDAGTSSVRFILFNKSGEIHDSHQIPLNLDTPQSGWIEQDANEIADKINECIEEVMKRNNKEEICAVGITNQRETAVAWDASTGKPLCKAIVWQDTRTDTMVDDMASTMPGGKDALRKQCGLPLSPYFSALKFRWMIENEPSVFKANHEGNIKFGTVDSWVMYNMMGVHITDVTNASRTMLMNIDTLQWDPSLCDHFGIPLHGLPKIVPSSMRYGVILSGPLSGLTIQGCLGDQQAATVGQLCLNIGDVKSTMGTGAFLLCNTGEQAVESKRGLLTTVLFQSQGKPALYALEGAIAVAGQTIRWFKEELSLIESPKECSQFAQLKLDSLSGGMASQSDPLFLSAFNGLYAPHWDPSARGVIAGLSLKSSKSDLCFAAFEGIAHRTREVIAAMRSESSFIQVSNLKIDGGMAVSDAMAQILASVCDVTVRRPKMVETTALGAAIAAGLSAGFWTSLDDVRGCVENEDALSTFIPMGDPNQRDRRVRQWESAIRYSKEWSDGSEGARHQKGGVCPFHIAVGLVAAGIAARFAYHYFRPPLDQAGSDSK